MFLFLTNDSEVEKLFRFISFALSQWHIKERTQFTCLIIFLNELSANSNLYHPHSDALYNIQLNCAFR